MAPLARLPAYCPRQPRESKHTRDTSVRTRCSYWMHTVEGGVAGWFTSAHHCLVVSAVRERARAKIIINRARVGPWAHRTGAAHNCFTLSPSLIEGPAALQLAGPLGLGLPCCPCCCWGARLPRSCFQDPAAAPGGRHPPQTCGETESPRKAHDGQLSQLSGFWKSRSTKT